MKKPLFLLITAFLFNVNAFGQTWSFLEKVVAKDRKLPQDSFGQFVTIEGEYAFITAWSNGLDNNGQNYLANAGAVYLYQKSESGVWTFLKKIVPSDRTLYDGFGFVLAMDSNYAVIGAPFEGAGFEEAAGAIYVFENKNGVLIEVKKLFEPVREYLGEFGYKVAISGDWIIVGQVREDEDENGQNTVVGAGAAYLYHRNGDDWAFAQKIVASDRGDRGDSFGFSVAIDGDYAAITASLNRDTGSVYIFKNEGGVWTEVQKLTTKDLGFGRGLAMEGSRLIVGSGGVNNPNGNTSTGAAFIFENYNGIWNETQRIDPSDGRYLDYFGFAIDFEGDYIVVGAASNSFDENDGHYAPYTGAAYIYQKNAEGVWIEIQKIVAPDRDPDPFFEDDFQGFGNSVGISGGYILAGADEESFDENGENYIYESGAAYFFQNPVLPLAFSALTGEKKDNKNILYWQTFIETNLQNMQVQRSIDGVNFQPIATVPAHKTASTYSYEDATAVARVTNFYRVSFNEADGRKELSNTISIAATAIPFTISIRPNPFTTTFSIVANTGLSASTTMNVHWYNTAGRKVYTEIRFLNPGDNTISLNTATLTKGVYMVEFMLSDGRRKVEKLVKE